MDTLLLKSLGLVRIFLFKEVLMHLFDRKYRKDCNMLYQILLQFKTTVFKCNIFKHLIYFCDGKAEFYTANTYTQYLI